MFPLFIFFPKTHIKITIFKILRVIITFIYQSLFSGSTTLCNKGLFFQNGIITIIRFLLCFYPEIAR